MLLRSRHGTDHHAQAESVLLHAPPAIIACKLLLLLLPGLSASCNTTLQLPGGYCGPAAPMIVNL